MYCLWEQLLPVNGVPVFDSITSKAVAQKLGCMTSINIWRDTVYDELTINERQKQDQTSSLLNEVGRVFPSIEALKTEYDRKGCRQV